MEVYESRPILPVADVRLSDDSHLNRDLSVVARSAAQEFSTLFSVPPPAGIRPVHILYHAELPEIRSTPDIHRYKFICRSRIAITPSLSTNSDMSYVTFSLTPGVQTGLSNLAARWRRRSFYIACLSSGAIILPLPIGGVTPRIFNGMRKRSFEMQNRLGSPM